MSNQINSQSQVNVNSFAEMIDARMNKHRKTCQECQDASADVGYYCEVGHEMIMIKFSLVDLARK
jgi:hypothetical protein